MTTARVLFFGFLVLSAECAVAQSPVEDPHLAATHSLPASWHGTWAGELTVYDHAGTSFEKGMELTIRPEADSTSYSWRMTSSLGGRTMVREYQLVPEFDAPGHFKIDEKNGIVLDVWLVGGTLHTYYKDGEILIDARYELRETGLFVELASIEMAEPRISTLTGEGFEIVSYRLGGLQTGTLRKQEEQ